MHKPIYKMVVSTNKITSLVDRAGRVVDTADNNLKDVYRLRDRFVALEAQAVAPGRRSHTLLPIRFRACPVDEVVTSVVYQHMMRHSAKWQRVARECRMAWRGR